MHKPRALAHAFREKVLKPKIPIFLTESSQVTSHTPLATHSSHDVPL